MMTICPASDRHAATEASNAAVGNATSPTRCGCGGRAAVARPRDAGLVGFTLIELLAVIAVLGILAGILLPSLSAARDSAHRAKAKVQFNQWAAAIESFRAEYGYYPAFDASALVNGGATTTLSGDHLFHDLLAGRKRDGSAPSAATATAAGNQNRKRIPFHVFSDDELTATDAPFPHLIKNAFGALSLAVLVDRNLDGRIDAIDYSAFPAVALPDGTMARPSSSGTLADIPSVGVRANVVFYCADPKATASDPRFIFSWK